MEPLIRLENVSYTYPGDDVEPGMYAVNNLSLDINEGEFVAILGHNGSGKSTTAKLMNMILTPNSGKIFVEGKCITGEDFTDEDVFDVRKKIGMVFQNPDNQIVATIVEEDVAFGPENLGVPSEEIRRRVNEALDIVNMREYARHAPHKLSGGQKQRVAIAGVIAMRPKCIIFDESTAMLDPGGRREVLDTIRKLNSEHGMTVLNITHYMNEAAEADRIIVINDGELLMDGTPDEIFAQRDALNAVGLEVPQCAELIHALRKAGIQIDGDTISSPKACADLLQKAFQTRAN